MNILYCGDGNIADGLLLSVLSLLRYTPEPLHIYVLTARVETEQRVFEPLPAAFTDYLDRRAGELVPGSRVERLDVTHLFEADPPLANLDTRFTPCCMLRLYADLVPELPDKILYLDNDVLCRGDFSTLYRQDLTGYELGGVPDYYGRWFFRSYLLRMDYVNSGVLLLNMAAIRESGLFAACRRRCREKKMFMPDQSAINKLATYKRLLPRRYNEQRRLGEDTVLQHFTTSFRFFPWFHAVSVKPWDVDRMHSVLELYEYDDLLAAAREEKSAYEKERVR